MDGYLAYSMECEYQSGQAEIKPFVSTVKLLWIGEVVGEYA